MLNALSRSFEQAIRIMISSVAGACSNHPGPHRPQMINPRVNAYVRCQVPSRSLGVYFASRWSVAERADRAQRMASLRTLPYGGALAIESGRERMRPRVFRALRPCRLAALQPECLDFPLLDLIGKVDESLTGRQVNLDADPLCVMWLADEGRYGAGLKVPLELGNIRDHS